MTGWVIGNCNFGMSLLVDSLQSRLWTSILKSDRNFSDQQFITITQPNS
ncbi:hypothetical protein H6G33_27945 [Calothrix sp. FACHB-1219]|nr:hypothetical protein [Calothrix sp. FACHB-1219]